MTRSILVGLGGRTTEGACYTEAAASLATDLARRHDAKLTGVTVAAVDKLKRVGSVPIGGGAAAAELRQHRIDETHRRIDAAVKDFEERCVAASVDFRVKHEERSEPFDYLISLARYHDLSVIGLRGLFEFGVNGEAHYDPASAFVRLIEGGVRPLLAAGPEPREVRRVLISYSGSPQSAKTMRRFIQMGLWPDAEVCLASFGDDHERCQRHLRHAAAYCRMHGVETSQEHRPGGATSGLMSFARKWDADLIVMGNSHRNLISRKVLGDTMLEVIRLSDRHLFLSQ